MNDHDSHNSYPSFHLFSILLSMRKFRFSAAEYSAHFSRLWGIKLAMGIYAERWSDDVHSRRFTLDIIIEKKNIAKILFWRKRQQPRECSLNCHSLLSLIKNVRLFLVVSFREVLTLPVRANKFYGFLRKRLETHNNFREMEWLIWNLLLWFLCVLTTLFVEIQLYKKIVYSPRRSSLLVSSTTAVAEQLKEPQFQLSKMLWAVRERIWRIKFWAFEPVFLSFLYYFICTYPHPHNDFSEWWKYNVYVCGCYKVAKPAASKKRGTMMMVRIFYNFSSDFSQQPVPARCFHVVSGSWEGGKPRR